MKRISLLLIMALTASTAQAKVVLPDFFGDNMVLQRNAEVKIWGTADAGKTVVVAPSWTMEKVKVQAASDGKWTASVKTADAGGPYEIVISDGEKLTLSNVLLGEVWFCSGQSNMEMPMKGFWNQPTENSTEYIMGAKASRPIRMCNFPMTGNLDRQYDVDTEWKENTPEAVAEISATAYFFAEYMQGILDVPVGIIVSAYGGSTIEAWMDRETLSSFPSVDMSMLDTRKVVTPTQQTPTLLYNAMLAPVIGYTIAGMIWYQGCSNCWNASVYEKLQPAFVSMVREQWGIGDFPFYYVQISPFIYEGVDGRSAAYLREVQVKNLEDIPNSGMAVTMDVGSTYCIHPPKKLEVGRRLAYMALDDNYGINGIDSRSPVYESMNVNDAKAIVSFKTGERGIAPIGVPLDGFEMAGADKVFHKAVGRIVDLNKVEVTCPEVAEPVAVRYAFSNCPEISIINMAGLPASPFRTDNW